MQARGDDVGLNSGHTGSHVSGNVRLQVRQHGGHLRVWHTLLVHLLGRRYVAEKFRTLRHQRRPMVGGQTRRSARTIGLVRRRMLDSHGNVLETRSQTAASHRHRLRSPHGYKRKILYFE